MNGHPSEPAPAADLLKLWQANADAWAQAVRSAGIESRRLVTDHAVLQAVLRWSPTRVLDVGCGEGWLARALTRQGVAVRGVDAIPRLVELAQAADASHTAQEAQQAHTASKGDYAVATLAELPASPLAEGFDLWVCNFSLFHEADAPALLAAARQRLAPGGRLVIQTLHASATPNGGDEPDGWQPGSWGGCGSGFADPIPWFFRSRPSWQGLLSSFGYTELEVQEPSHPVTGKPCSWLFTARSPLATSRTTAPGP